MGFDPIRNPLDIVRLAFYLCALTDGSAVLQMLFPSIGIALFGGDPTQMSSIFLRTHGLRPVTNDTRGSTRHSSSAKAMFFRGLGSSIAYGGPNKLHPSYSGLTT